MKESIAVVGAGSWGTAFAAMLAGRHESVTLWANETEVCAEIRDRRENRAFLPGIALPPAIRPTDDLAEAVSGKTAVIFAVPSHHLREIAARAAAHLSPDACLVSLAKGVENGTLKRMTEVLAEASPELPPVSRLFPARPSPARWRKGSRRGPRWRRATSPSRGGCSTRCPVPASASTPTTT